jgi:hypothetical protein
MGWVSQAHKVEKVVDFYFEIYILNPTCRRRFVPQTVTRDIISRVITRMPTPAEKWKDYPIETKDELFKDFMVSIYVF